MGIQLKFVISNSSEILTQHYLHRAALLVFVDRKEGDFLLIERLIT